MTARSHRWDGWRVPVAVMALVAAVAATQPGVSRGHAASMALTSTTVAAFRPSELPPACTSSTDVAAADTWVNQSASTTNYGSSTTLTVTARGGGSARALVRFSLPAAPQACTLASATLRLFNANPAAGRTIQVYAAATAWAESGVTYNTMPATTGTAVDRQSAAGWMEWTVTTHVQSFYSGANHGFVVRDASEGGGAVISQAFHSREAANAPSLVLQWQ